MLYPSKYKKTIIAIHIAVWLIVILAPLTFFDKGDKFEMDKLIPMISLLVECTEQKEVSQNASV